MVARKSKYHVHFLIKRKISIGNEGWEEAPDSEKIQKYTLPHIHSDCIAMNLQRQSLTGHVVNP